MNINIEASSRYTRYQYYRPVDSSWIQEIPESWSVLPLKRIATLINGSTPKSGEDEFWDGEVPWITPADMGKDSSPYISGGKRNITQNGLESCGTTLVPPKTVIISSRAPIGTLAIADVSLCTNQGCKSLVPRSYNFKYLYYVLAISKENLNVLGRGTTFVELSTDELSAYEIPQPSLTEQQSICDFLDHETAKIDTLIDKQQQLIKLLKEKRQAVISHAVTKGLNPDAPMKDSGVEWLGEVPEHWTVLRAKHLLQFVTSGSRGWAEYYADEGSLFFRITNLTRDTIYPKLESIQNVAPPRGSEGERSKIQNGDLLISITADLGSVCVADEAVSGGFVSQHVALSRPNYKVADSRWLGYFILSDVSKEQLLGAGYGGTKVQLSLEDIRELSCVLPPEKEQISVVSYISEKTKKFEKLIDCVTNQLDLLKERRNALISAAVTGKIDVRNFKADDVNVA